MQEIRRKKLGGIHVRLRTLLAVIISISIPIQTFAQSHVIAQLGNFPVIGRIQSTDQLQSDVAHYNATFRAAGDRIGLTPKEYASFAQRVAARKVAYVTIPRHLDAMTWGSGGNVYAVDDVIIPPNTKGWEVDLQEGHRVLALFVPARCGNLAVLRKAMPVLAQATHPHHRKLVAAAAVAPRKPKAAAALPPVAQAPAAQAPVAQAPVAQAPAAQAPVAQAPAVGLPPSPPPAVAPFQTVATSTPPATHHNRLWPLLLMIPLVAFLGGHGSNTPSFPVIGGPPPVIGGGPPPGFGGGVGPVPVPTPSAGCPQPAALFLRH